MSESDEATEESTQESTEASTEEKAEQSRGDGGDGDGGDGDGGGTILDDGGVDAEARAGRSLGIDPQSEPDDDTRHEMEEERERRLDPENRPDGAEVDNTQRDFDVDRGMFTDADDYDESGEAPYADPEDPNSSASDDDAAEDDSSSHDDADSGEDGDGETDRKDEQDQQDSDASR